MHFIDTHAHYNLPAFSDDWKITLRKANEAGVERFICPAISFETNEQMLRMFADQPNVSIALGIHPKRGCPRMRQDKDRFPNMPAIRSRLSSQLDILDALDKQIDSIEQMIDANSDKVVAIGKVGLDWSSNPGEFEREIQCALLMRQIELALRKHLPMILHIRDAHRDAADILHRYKGAVRGVVHCFASGPNEAKEYFALGLHIGIGGKVSHDRCDGVREAVRIAPSNRLLLETDAPFVVPTGFPSNRNDSTAIPDIAQVISGLREESLAQVAEATTENALNLFCRP